MLIVATGDGKGKTTAAIGQAIRALGNDKRVYFAQFIKSDGYPSGEDCILRSFGDDRVTFLKGGKGFVGILGDHLPFKEHQAAAKKTLATVREACEFGAYGLIVLDEVHVAIALGLLDVDEVSSFLDAMPCSCDIMMTGRHADERIVARADFVTECLEVKHPFHQHVAAKKGIEY